MLCVERNVSAAVYVSGWHTRKSGAVKSVTEQRNEGVATRGEREREREEEEEEGEGGRREQAETASQTFAKEMQSVK